jgi:O-antigen/teichoic acid export membrane protein/SAM-dependent methyltransferase
VILTIGGLGVPHSIAYFAATKSVSVRKVYANSLLLGVLQCLVLVPIAILVIPKVLSHQFAHVIPLSLVYVTAVPLSLIAGIHIGILQGLGRMEEYNLQRILPAILYLLGLLVFFIRGKTTLGSVVGLLLLSLLCSSLLGFRFVVREGAGTYFGPVDRTLLREMLGYGFKTQLTQAAYVLNLRLDQLILSLLLPPKLLGYYAVAATFSGMLLPFSQAIGTVTLPDTASRDKDSGVKRVVAILRVSFLITLVLALGLVVSTAWLLPFLFGVSFRPAITPARILMFGAVLLGMNHVLTQGLLGLNRPGVPALAQTISLGAMVILLPTLVPRFGITGAAITSDVTYLVTFVVLWFHLARHSRLSLRALWPSAGDVRAVMEHIRESLQRVYDWLLISSYPTNGVAVPPRVLRYYVNLTGYEYAQTIRRFVADKQRVLIVGDAGGRDYYFLKMAGKEVWVLDVAPQSLPQFVLGDVTTLPFRDGMFDAVVMAEVIEHVVRDYDALKECRRVLRDNGVLVLTVPFYHDDPEWHVRIHSPQSIRRLLEACGFRIVEYIEKGGGCTLLERWRVYHYTIHGLNLLTFLFMKRTFYQRLNSMLAAIDSALGKRQNSLWHRWSYLYGAFIMCEKSAERDFRALNVEAFSWRTPALGFAPGEEQK